MLLFDFDFSESPYQEDKAVKDIKFTEKLMLLTSFHQKNCLYYGEMLKAVQYKKESISHYSELPFLPVGLLKRLTLSSLPEGALYKVASSSGTSGTNKSRIILDGETRIMQQKALTAIGGDFLGKKRVPMLVIDRPQTIEYENGFSARTAGITGFSIFGKNRTFALKENMMPDYEKIQDFLYRYGKESFFVFGFTFLVWNFFEKLSEMKEYYFDFSNGMIVHGGGWKRLADKAVSRTDFQKKLKEIAGITQIHDYYGMAEQTGSIFMECEYGHLHCSDFSGIMIRKPEDFSVAKTGEKGIIQTMSLLPGSYPGHNLLTEDEGVILGEDDCPCQRKGVYFQVLGRLKQAEIRGCSDVYTAD
ncbi:LuxE/PaaK family acyltransferase [Anaeromicropila populeti]|uniref:Acyl-protein synthetase, LuxE n=1 Tax=Anaeromicropila populeti TaxID=37658 RepID=A0A1I6J1S0_9FIRM|nr:acyl-protein synthetase [Anaeromicropila populeti]SFR72470.1 Acyl-protein synthetase, LuxE [Anaeromicropila populeti]